MRVSLVTSNLTPRAKALFSCSCPITHEPLMVHDTMLNTSFQHFRCQPATQVKYKFIPKHKISGPAFCSKKGLPTKELVLFVFCICLFHKLHVSKVIKKHWLAQLSLLMVLFFFSEVAFPQIGTGVVIPHDEISGSQPATIASEMHLASSVLGVGELCSWNELQNARTTGDNDSNHEL